MAPCLPLVLMALVASNPDVARAVNMMDELQYPEAARALDAAGKRPGNDRATVLQILELQAVIASTLDQGARAKGFFRALVSIEPDYQLSRKYAPKVLAPFFEAKSWISRRGALRLEADPAPDGAIASLSVRVAEDPMKLAREVRFHARADGGAWRAEVVPLTAAGRASISVTARRLEWWVELLGEAQGVLAQQGSQEQPVAWGAVKLEPPPPPAVAARPPPAVAPAVPAKPPPAKVSASSPGAPPPLVIAGWGLVALGGASAGVGGYFGWRSSQARARVAGAEVGPDGLVRGLTQAEAFALDERARRDAVVANALFGAGGAAGAGGIAMVVFGQPVEVGVGPGGVSLEGPIP